MSQATPDTEHLDRDGTIERLLVSGLEYYFAGEHERAIDVWTRVLFLDRGHSRARAYIERARGAIAEQQRESDELVARGMEAFEAGQAADARQLLSAAVAQGGPHDVAVALLERLERLHGPAVSGQSSARPRRRARRSEAPDAERRRPVWIGLALVLVTIVAAAAYVVISVPQLQVTGLTRSAAPARLAAADESLPIVRTSDLRLSRAQSLVSSGHLREALGVLEQIRPGDSAAAEADRLRALIERRLLSDLPPVTGRE